MSESSSERSRSKNENDKSNADTRGSSDTINNSRGERGEKAKKSLLLKGLSNILHGFGQIYQHYQGDQNADHVRKEKDFSNQEERQQQQIELERIQKEFEREKMEATNRVMEESRREAEMREQQRQDDLRREKDEEERMKRQEEEREKQRAKQLEEHKNKLKEMSDGLQSDRDELRNMRRVASEEIRQQQQTTLDLAQQRGKENATKISGVMRKTYEHGVKDGFLHFQKKIEEATTKENGAVLVHDGSEEAKSITDKLLLLLEKRSFAVATPVLENDEMPSYSGQCRLKWLVLYIALRQDSSTNHICDTILRAEDYLKNPVFHACQKLFILQTNTENLSKADALTTTLGCLENTKAIVACIPDYHCAVVEKVLKRNTRFDDVVNKLMVDAESCVTCVTKN